MASKPGSNGTSRTRRLFVHVDYFLIADDPSGMLILTSTDARYAGRW